MDIDKYSFIHKSFNFPSNHFRFLENVNYLMPINKLKWLSCGRKHVPIHSEFDIPIIIFIIYTNTMDYRFSEVNPLVPRTSL